MGCNNKTLISNNVWEVKNSDKRLRHLNTLKTQSILTEWYSFKKRIPNKTTKKNGMTILKEDYSFWMKQLSTWNKKSFILEERKTDKSGIILLLDVIIDEQNFILVNIYNANMEKDHVNNIDEFSKMIKNVNNISAKQIIFRGDFNLFFDSLLKSQVGNPVF